MRRRDEKLDTTSPRKSASVCSTTSSGCAPPCARVPVQTTLRPRRLIGKSVRVVTIRERGCGGACPLNARAWRTDRAQLERTRKYLCLRPMLAAGITISAWPAACVRVPKNRRKFDHVDIVLRRCASACGCAIRRFGAVLWLRDARRPCPALRDISDRSRWGRTLAAIIFSHGHEKRKRAIATLLNGQVQSPTSATFTPTRCCSPSGIHRRHAPTCAAARPRSQLSTAPSRQQARHPAAAPRCAIFARQRRPSSTTAEGPAASPAFCRGVRGTPVRMRRPDSGRLFLPPVPALPSRKRPGASFEQGRKLLSRQAQRSAGSP